MTAPRHLVDEVYREKFAIFLMKCFETLHPADPPLLLSWYLKAVCHALLEVHEGRTTRLVITVPPRHLKSITASVAYPLWLLGQDPSKKILVASYSQDLARTHSEHCRTILETDWYRRLFPETRISDRGNRQLELITTHGGYRKAVSVGGSVTGHGADSIIVDDLMKADEVHSEAAREEAKRWFDNSVITRLNDKGRGSIISIQQRLHEDDPAAYLLDKGYSHLNLPAIGEKTEEIPIGNGLIHVRQPGDLLDPLREDHDILNGLRRELGPQVFSAQYQQNPVAPEGNLIRLEWFPRYPGPGAREMFTKVVQSWDTATSEAPTSDWSVCTVWGYRRGRWWLVDVLRERLDYPKLKRAVQRMHDRWQPEIVMVEDANAGRSLCQEFRTSGPFRVQLHRPKEDKETRLIGQTARLEDGLCVLPEVAPWLAAFEAELRAFPSGRYDDQVDSMTQFLIWEQANWRWPLKQRGSQGRLVEPIRLKRRPALPPLEFP
jgi:predicted phage terminase large subunit-like protein